ncbi:hypothetical protein MZO42_02005 [Sphingomonas psychrotolerans]|uniref:Uncharacterized protein n=1 Tax=Sphingomonas psychrotolerans TaxID=1327635 RepID=A0ABU3MZ02_9SPHN|nr:hypothetical protein [Sphingomonas psychrotolerans]MDT8757462.1 hypothetical protein [Sphingomonas psychrotolerans]
MTKILNALVLGAALVAAPATAAPRDTPEQQLQKLLAGRTPGKPVDCIPLTGSNSSQIIEGKAIVYRVGGKLYVNEPRSGAESLNDDDILVTKVFGSQLCSIDTVNLVDRSSNFQRGFVVLGKFVPWTKVKTAAK